MSARPLIAVCSAREPVRWGSWRFTADMLPGSYVAAVQRAGAVALMVPPDEAVAEHPEGILDLVDGLLLAGGSDVAAGSYRESSVPTDKPTLRDRTEIALGSQAVAQNMPVLAICRGMQLLNVMRGGTLRSVEHPDAHGRDGGYVDHEVALEHGSLAARAVGTNRAHVRSAHHERLDRLGHDLVVSGYAVPDAQVEAIELPSCRFVLGVLWHPEQHPESSVIPSFVAAARGEAR